MKVARAVVCLSLWLAVCRVSGFHIPLKMNKTIQNLLQHYNVPPHQIFDGKPVFSKERLPGSLEVQRVFMAGVLETYDNLFSKMLRQLPTPSPQTAGNGDHPASDVNAPQGLAGSGPSGDVREGLVDLLDRVRNLRKYGYQDVEKLLQGLHSLRHIQLENTVVQSKALWELTRVYTEASTLSEKQRKRRRRQARGSKTHQRA
uniref:Interferon gamma n=1 Tax=Channa argus TaxID=215402 RepID=A0A8G0W3M6_CHAAH|nr:interferon gamma [Channa argus]